MIRVTYTATRELSSDHVSGEVVTLDFSVAELTPSREISRDSQQALNGRRETLLHYGRYTWPILTGPLDGSSLAEVVEFLCSVEGGESFTFEPWCHEPGPALDLDFASGLLRVATSYTCRLTSENWQMMRLVGDGTGGANDVYQLSFEITEQP